MDKIHLHNWAVVTDNDPFKAPEIRGSYLRGTREDELKPVVTSRIMSVNGREITTRNTIYVLGEIDLEYLQWIKDDGLEYDYDNPIKMKKV